MVDLKDIEYESPSRVPNKGEHSRSSLHAQGNTNLKGAHEGKYELLSLELHRLKSRDDLEKENSEDWKWIVVLFFMVFAAAYPVCKDMLSG